MRARGLKQYLLADKSAQGLSRPMRARGLKRAVTADGGGMGGSRPMRARGLKLECEVIRRVHQQSRPMRARGLKPNNSLYWFWCRKVAPHAGAWVETHCAMNFTVSSVSRAPCGRVG